MEHDAIADTSAEHTVSVTINMNATLQSVFWRQQMLTVNIHSTKAFCSLEEALENQERHPGNSLRKASQ
jgi:hypothetical protein